MKVTVTQEDIDLGVRLNGEQCPVARALSRLGYGYVWAGYFDIGTERGAFKPSISMRRFMSRFDDGKPVAPGTFFLKVLE